MERGGRSRRRKKNVKEEDSIKYIPEDIVRNILPVLPRDSILRFRCVSKRWCSWISENISTNRKVIFPRSGNSRYYGNYSSFRSIDQSTQVEDRDIYVGEIDTSPCDYKAHICGSCNGFLLIKVGMFLLLWDLSIAGTKSVLGFERLRNYPCKKMYSGLCCSDYRSNDYKAVLALRDEHELLGPCEVLVGSFRTQSWKTVEVLHGVRFERPGVALNNNLHWWFPEKIMCFDSKIDQLKDLPLPQPKKAQSRILGVGSLDGCLCMSRRENSTTVEILSMKQYGVGESWVVLFRFSTSMVWNDFMVMPLFFTNEKRREILMQVGTVTRSIVVYNIDNKSFKDIANVSARDSDFVIMYEETFERPNWRQKKLTSTNCQKETELRDRPRQVWAVRSCY